MIKDLFAKLALVVMAVVLSGCAGYTPSIASNDEFAPGVAYVYGRFYISAQKNALAMDGHQSMGFGIKCANNASYVIRFSVDNPLQVIKVTPSECSIAEIVYTNADGFVRGRRPFTGNRELGVLKPGVAYYLGDFNASTTTNVVGTMIQRRWDVQTITDLYEDTTAVLKEKFPRFSELTTENRFISRGSRSTKAPGI